MLRCGTLISRNQRTEGLYADTETARLTLWDERRG